MKIVSWNINGLRAVCKKGFLDWFGKTGPDILCLQEVRADKKQLPLEVVEPEDYFVYFNPATKKGMLGWLSIQKKSPWK